MNRINPEEFYTKEKIEQAKKLGKLARKKLGIGYMSEAELTENQRESIEPIGDMGYYRMYRWECSVCATHGKKMPYSECIMSGYQHCIEFKHEKHPRFPPVSIRGGVFPKEDLYQE